MWLLNPYRFGPTSIPSVLLLHFNGANNSTTFTDVYGHTVTANGDAKITTGVNDPFGNSTGVLALDGTGDYAAVTASSDFAFGTGNFTIEGWIKSTTTGAYNGFISNYPAGNVNGKWEFKTRFASANNVGFTYNNGTSYIDITLSPAVNVNDNTWHHMAVCRNGNNILIFVDGVLKNTTAISGSQIIGLSGNAVHVGFNPTDSVYFTGNQDEIRITKGTARYTATFTPPSAPFTE